MNQHFVPRVYLKNFATKIKNGYFINTFDKIENRYFRPNIKNICSEIDFYTLPTDNSFTKDLLFIENFYAKSIEPTYSKVYNILTNNNIFEITNAQRIEIVLAVLHLHMRNPKVLKRALFRHSTEISKLCKESVEKGIKGITYLNEDFSFREWNNDSIVKYFFKNTTKEFKEKHLTITNSIVDFHKFAKIEVNITRGDAHFLTSDNPLALEDFITKQEEPFLKSTEFILPLNKHFIVKLYHDNTKEINVIRRGFIPNGNVNMINETIFNQSSRFVFGGKEDFDEYQKTREFLNTDSFELRIDAIKQILQLVSSKLNAHTQESYDLLKNYYNKYKEQGFMSQVDEQEMMQRFSALVIEFKNKKIN